MATLLWVTEMDDFDQTVRGDGGELEQILALQTHMGATGLTITGDYNEAFSQLERGGILALVTGICMTPGTRYANGRSDDGRKTGIVFALEVRAKHPNLPIIFLSWATDPLLRLPACRLGLFVCFYGLTFASLRTIYRVVEWALSGATGLFIEPTYEPSTAP